MSLITTASPWISEDTKKRIPTIPRKSLSSTSSSTTTSYSQPSVSSPSSFIEPLEEYKDTEPSVSPQQLDQDSRTSRINDMIQKMTNLNVENAGNGLADFKPLENPVFIAKKTDVLGNTTADYETPPPSNSLYTQPPQKYNQSSTQFSPNTINLANLSNYKQSYEVPTANPYYTKMGISQNSSIDEKLMDRLSYITHLLEEMQSERTNNVAEEFVMYSLLGIFVIYIVDAFSRTGRYIR